MPFRATFDCLWCGTAAHLPRRPTTSRAGPSSARTASARPATTGSCGSGCARRSRSAGRRRGRGAAARPPAAPPAAGRGHAVAPTPTGRHGRLLRGPRRRVRRLVPAPRPLRARRRSTTPPGTPSSTRPAAGSTRCRSRGEIVELAAGTGWWSPLLASQAASCRSTTPRAAPLDRARERLRRPSAARPPPRPRRVGRAGPAGRRPVHRLLAEPRRARATGRVPGPRPPLAASPAGGSRSSTRCRTRRRARPTTPTPTDDRSVRRLDDGREFTIVKVYYAPDELDGGARAPPGSTTSRSTTTGRFFVLGDAPLA